MSTNNKIINKDLRLKIVKYIKNANEGHIPSSLSILDIINYLYNNILKYKIGKPEWDKRDIFILSKGHGAMALYVVLNKYGLLKTQDLRNYGSKKSKLGGHPDMTKIKFVEASTGSLGHGICTAVGCALASKIKKNKNKVFCLLGDGETHEGTVWEAANIAANRKLDNLIAIIDHNKSAEQLMPIDNLKLKWKAFGWNVLECDGHSNISMSKCFKKIFKSKNKKPNLILAKTIKGKGIPFIEGHGIWHHRIPNDYEFNLIKKILS
jgi:transketolase